MTIFLSAERKNTTMGAQIVHDTTPSPRRMCQRRSATLFACPIFRPSSQGHSGWWRTALPVGVGHSGSGSFGHLFAGRPRYDAVLRERGQHTILYVWERQMSSERNKGEPDRFCSRPTNSGKWIHESVLRLRFLHGQATMVYYTNRALILRIWNRRLRPHLLATLTNPPTVRVVSCGNKWRWDTFLSDSMWPVLWCSKNRRH